MTLMDKGDLIECLSLGDSDSFSVPEQCTVEQWDDYFYLRYAVNCEDGICPPYSTFKLYVTAGIQNPTWITSANLVDSIEVTTNTIDMLYQIDEKKSEIYA